MLNGQLVIATTNQGKLQEINAIFAAWNNLELNLKSLANYVIPEPDEPYASFMENAIHKAKYYAKHTQLPTLSEDAGLCVEALKGFPGVRTKDFIEQCGGSLIAFSKLEQMLSGIENRNTMFNCAAALYIPQEDRLFTFAASVSGKIVFSPRGNHGFGFDPIFVPSGYEQTMAELGEQVKNKIGHRALAIRGIMQQLMVHG